MKVLKFGGTSVGSADRIKKVAKLINNNERKIVVLSAVSGTTNALVSIANCLFAKQHEEARSEILALRDQYKIIVNDLFSTDAKKQDANGMLDEHFNYLESFTKDMFTIYEERAVLAQGELMSTALMQYHLEEIGTDSVLLPALNFMRIQKDTEPDDYYIKQNLNKELEAHTDCNLFITQGYISRNAYGEIDNLKRGGSDYTASIIGAAVAAANIQIWTDIDGMHNNDPREVENTFPISELSYNEAAELAYFGAKILHPSSIRPAKDNDIPVHLKNTMDPEAPGTTISSYSNAEGIKAIAAKDGITAVKIRSGRMLLAYGFLRQVFEVFERFKTPIDMITTSEVSISLTVDDTSNLDKIVSELQEHSQVEVDSNQCIICVVGDLIGERQGVAGQIFDSLKEIPVRMISFGGSNNNVSLLVHADQKKAALLALNKGLFHV